MRRLLHNRPLPGGGLLEHRLGGRLRGLQSIMVRLSEARQDDLGQRVRARFGGDGPRRGVDRSPDDRKCGALVAHEAFADDALDAGRRRAVSASRRALTTTEVLFVEVLRSWIKSLGPGEGGRLGAMADPHIGPALRLMHEQLDRPWSLRDLGLRVGLGRSAFSARFTKLVGQSMHRYLIARRMSEAAFLLESSDEGIARIASRVG